MHHYSEKDASKVIRETLRGIQHMHQKGIAHRDLKVRSPRLPLPSTSSQLTYACLLLSSREADASVKVADFGFAKKSVADNDLTALVGTPPYMGMLSRFSSRVCL